MSTQVEDMVKSCRVCIKDKDQPPEPLITSNRPNQPWRKVGTDLFEWQKKHYLLVVDYTSRFILTRKLRSTLASEVVDEMSEMFSVHGSPEVVISDNGPQYTSSEFRQFSQDF